MKLCDIIIFGKKRKADLKTNLSVCLCLIKLDISSYLYPIPSMFALNKRKKNFYIPTIDNKNE